MPLPGRPFGWPNLYSPRRDWLGRGDGVGPDERHSPPGAPAKASALDARHTAFPQPGRILTGETKVGDHDLTAGPQYPHSLVDGGPPRVVLRQIVDREVADDKIEGVVGKREIGHVGGMQFDPVRDALGISVRPSGLRGVAGLVGPPDVHSDS